jgi:general stress protein 26
MSNIENLHNIEGIAKLKQLVETITTCFFCTDLNNPNGSTATIMTAQQVDDEGNIWFFSGLDTDRNQIIKKDKKVQLFFSDTSKHFYLVATGEAEIVLDKAKMNELWNPFLKIWFNDGVNDKNISLIKVNAKNAYYWDNEGGKMVIFFKMIASVVTGNDYVDAKEGNIKL